MLFYKIPDSVSLRSVYAAPFMSEDSICKLIKIYITPLNFITLYVVVFELRYFPGADGCWTIPTNGILLLSNREAYGHVSVNRF